MDTKVERRLSVNSDSSIEPMETSSSNKTGISEANSSLAVKTSNDSDNVDSDENEEYQNNYENSIRRKNVRLMVDTLLKRFIPNSNKNNMKNKCMTDSSAPNDKNSDSDQIDDGQSLNLSGNNNTNNCTDNSMKYVCPICDVISHTPHEFTAHIRGHNTEENNQHFTCRICSKVRTLHISLVIQNLMYFYFYFNRFYHLLHL